jgi:hypothetical protein
MADEAWEELLRQFPWPAERPSVTGPHVNRIHGWLAEGTKEMIRKHLPSSGLVMELGTWMGKSAQYMLGMAPGIRLVCIDHWLGSPDINQMQAHRDMLPTIYDHCRYHLWPYRDQIVLLRMDMADGMRKVHEAGLQPGMVYVDGAHDAKSVEADASGAGSLFPAADLVGDDWERESVRQGVLRAVREFPKRRLSDNGKAWVMEL